MAACPVEKRICEGWLELGGCRTVSYVAVAAYHLRAENPLRSVLVTSAISGDGKTFVAGNLAQAIVRQHERRVLLIDADLRSPNLHTLLGAPVEPGLGECLSGAAKETAFMQHGQEGLYFIAAGKPTGNPSELISNGRLKALIERAAPCFDWIITDSPPCLPVADASVIAGFCDAVLLVVRSRVTPSSAAQKAHQDLQKTNRVAVVLNAAGEKTLNYGSLRMGSIWGRSEGRLIRGMIQLS